MEKAIEQMSPEEAQRFLQKKNESILKAETAKKEAKAAEAKSAAKSEKDKVSLIVETNTENMKDKVTSAAQISIQVEDNEKGTDPPTPKTSMGDKKGLKKATSGIFAPLQKFKRM